MRIQHSQRTTELDEQPENKPRKSFKDSLYLGIVLVFGIEMVLGTVLSVYNKASVFALLGTTFGAIVLLLLDTIPKFSSFIGGKGEKSEQDTAFQERIKRIWRQAYRVPTFLLSLLLVISVNAVIVTVPYMQADPYTHRAMPSLSDLLQNNQQGYAWLEKDGSCEFTTGQYHALVKEAAHVRLCSAQATDYSNFVYEVRMTIMAGDCGALTFRSDDANIRMYFFRICQNGTYLLGRYDGNPSSTTSKAAPILEEKLTPQPVIHQGLHQSNVIAIVANGGTIELWINHLHVSTVNDGTYQRGRIGLAANSFTQATEVAFSDARVWTFE